MISGRCNILSTIRYVSEFSKNRYGVTCSRVISINEGVNGLMFSRRQSNRFDRLSSLLIPSRMASSSTNDSKVEHEDSTTKGRNRLALEKSPYLLQHATNPVQWYPWGEEAFAKARQEDKVIFLSVGYSTCHWCHVMERESFEDSETAEIMNKFFVNVKVDREERPDVDQMYMTFIQNISGHGGWPMSVFLTPDLKPITGGTYFPPEDKYGQPSFKRVLLSVAKKWKENKSDVSTFSMKYVESLQRSIDSKNREEAQTKPQLNCARICLRQLERYYESEYGGFSEAPKFPQPVNLNFLFRMYAREPNGEFGPNCLEMCEYTLRKMANGGIHDHVGQGFARYSVDGKWHVPHFEKMLYDQGQLIQCYADAFVATKDPFFADIVDDIATYVTRDLRHKEGGFYSAEDADSLPTADATAKQEGAFYVWTYDEIKSLLNKNLPGSENLKLYQIFCYHYTIKENGNVAKSQDPHGELTGRNVLFVHESIEETAEKFRITTSDIKKYLKEACQILFEARSSRPRPHLDDKIITAWNGLMISGLSRAGAAMSNKQYIEYASEAAKFVEKYLYDETKKLLYRSCYRTEGDLIVHTSVKIHGFHCDYAFLVKGLLDLYEASFNAHWLEFAEQLQDTQDELFWDAKNGGYFSTTKDDPTILLRFKNDHDGAEPSGNSVACSNLLRLAAFLDRDEFQQKAEAIFLSFQSTLTRSPILVPEMVSALLDYHDTMTQIYIAGKPEAEDTKALIRVVRERLVPGRVLLLADQEQQDNILFRKTHVAGKMKPLNGLATAYVCRHHTCSLPVTNPDELATLLIEDEK